LPLVELVRRGAREILQRAIAAEVQVQLDEFAAVSLIDGRRALVRNGYLPTRAILITLGPVEVQVPKVRDRCGSGVKFDSALVPPYVRRSARVAAALPWPYLKGISGGDLGEALAVLVGEGAKGLSAAALGRPEAQRSEDYRGCTRRSLEGNAYALGLRSPAESLPRTSTSFSIPRQIGYDTRHSVKPNAKSVSMIERPFWRQRIESAWREAPIVWLSGVRRCGKTTLAQSLGPDQIAYVNCDLPIVEDMVRDPSLFFSGCTRPVVVFDEIHQLRDPARVLKIGADAFPQLKILATGSSTLAASKKFRDTLTGRKRQVQLTPVSWHELPAFQVPLLRRLFHGGLPPALLAESKQPALYREWLDSFFARDIQRLFGFRDINRFNTLFEYLLQQSGGQFEVTKTAGALGIARATVESHVRALEITHAIDLVRPFHGGGQNELVKQPKVYAFDTGFVSFARGWDPLRQEDLGVLWEHLVLEHLKAHFPDTPVHYWRDKQGREVDFVLAHRRDHVDAIECKWNPEALDGTALQVFRSFYPKGRNFLVSPLAAPGYTKRIGAQEVRVCTPSELVPCDGS